MVEPTCIYSIFHLNLAFSSIDKYQHIDVVQKCYWPLLGLIEECKIPLGIELTAYTLEAIKTVDPTWIEKLTRLLKQGMCEVIASGDSQIIGPLVPHVVNQHNLRLGNNSYRALLGVRPAIAYVNEQAVSAGLLDCYIDEGFTAVVVEWDNPYSHNPDWPADLLRQPQVLRSATGREIKVIWNHAVAFQKFQRYAHDEITLDDYQAYLDNATSPDCKAFPLYGSDAEVFNYRPGRYQTEAVTRNEEWKRIALLFTRLHQKQTVPLGQTI